MKKSALAILSLTLLAGCISSAPKAPTAWTIDKDHSAWPPSDIAQTADSVRVSRVDVCAPYNGARLAVLRPDGSIAFDGFNSFAVSPSALLKRAALDAVAQYGRFGQVLPDGSSARTRYALELDVAVLALDCREDTCEAVVELSATLLEGRNIVGIASGSAHGNGSDKKSAAANGNYSEAFSTAFFRAVADALDKLPVK